MRWLRATLFAVAALSFVATSACGPSNRDAKYGKKKKHVADDDDDNSSSSEDKGEKGVATENTWKTSKGYDTKIKIPAGWTFLQSKNVVLGVSDGDKAAFVMLGAHGKDEAVERGRKARDLLKLNTGAQTGETITMEINGHQWHRSDYENATAAGNPAHGVIITGAAPSGGNGIVVFIGYVRDGQDALSEDFRDAINSISPTN